MKASKIKKSKKETDTLSSTDKILQTLNLSKGMSINRAIVQASEYIDNQPNPLRFSNAIVQTLEVPLSYISDLDEAKVVALATVEQLLTMDTFEPDAAADAIALKLERIRKKMPFAFRTETVVTKKRGGKRDQARQIYVANKDLPTKEIIAIVAKELEVTLQNAYTYVYLVKKSLKV